MTATLPFLSRYLVLSLRRFGLGQTNQDTALLLEGNHWTLPSGANGDYTGEELHQLAASVGAEVNADLGPDVLWLLVADAEASGIFTALEVQETLRMFNRPLLHPRLWGDSPLSNGGLGNPLFLPSFLS